MKKSILVLVVAIGISFGVNAQAIQKPKKQTDSLISVKELVAFIDFMRKNYSIEWYETVKPQAVLTELWNWKLRQLADTTGKK